MQLGSMLPPSLSSDDRLSCLKKSRGSGGWPPDQERPPFLFCIGFLKRVLGPKGKPQDCSLGLEGPVCHQPLVQESINGNRSEEEPTIKFSVHDCENRCRSAASNGISRLQSPRAVGTADIECGHRGTECLSPGHTRRQIQRLL